MLEPGSERAACIHLLTRPPLVITMRVLDSGWELDWRGENVTVSLIRLHNVTKRYDGNSTNHLDLTSTQVMERALAHFPGAVVVVSHDRFFIDKIATRLLVFEDVGKVREVAGNWTIWQASIESESENEGFVLE